MPRLLIPSVSALASLAALAMPLAAADPVPSAASPAVPVYRSYNSANPVVTSPPAVPTAPLPSATYSGPPVNSYADPNSVSGSYSSGRANYGTYSGTGSAFGPPTSYYTAKGSGAASIYGTPGGYEGRLGSPYHYFDPNGGQYVTTGNPYVDHFGPGFQRHSLHGHYRFPYYNYRAPWYYPGRAVYNRDTNFAW